jgi:hypothetical protein
MLPGMKHSNPQQHLDAATLRRLAVRGSCDPRTIQKVLSGARVRGLAGERARQALLDEELSSAPANDGANLARSGGAQ